MTNICTPDQTYVDYKVTEDFWYSELIHSDTAIKNKIENIPSPIKEKNLQDSAKYLWQPARNALGVPMNPSCAYRGPKVNKLVGGSDTSAHLEGYAMDFTAPQFGLPIKIVKHLYKFFKENGIKWDQMILEYPKHKNGGWVHLAWKNKKGEQRMQTLVKNDGTRYIPTDFNKL